MAKILNYWNNLLRVILSLLSPEHIKIKIKKKKNVIVQAEQQKV